MKNGLSIAPALNGGFVLFQVSIGFIAEAYLLGGVAALTEILTRISQSIAGIGVIMSIVARSRAKSE